jgi:DNA replication protein DnaC
MNFSFISFDNNKIHLMTALGLKACSDGCSVIFQNAVTLTAELREAKDGYQLRKQEKSIANADLLLFDELIGIHILVYTSNRD